MIVITGDIHQASLRTRDQGRLSDGQTELQLCGKYLSICATFGIPATIFVPGILARQETADFAQIVANFPDCEFGGHSWNCYRPYWLFRASRFLLGLANGPACFQRRDIIRTKSAITAVTHRPVTSWRDHAYRCDRNTNRLLAETGIDAVSNRVEPGAGITLHSFGPHAIRDIAINTLPDHENLHHCDPHHGMDVTSWMNRVLDQLAENERAGIHSVILAHPACMEIEDGMATFREFLARLPAEKCVTMRDLP